MSLVEYEKEANCEKMLYITMKLCQSVCSIFILLILNLGWRILEGW